MLLPLNSNLAIAQAAATPNTKLSGTAMSAAINVNFMADKASASTSAEIYVSTPFRKASVKTAASGMNKNKLKNTSVVEMSAHRTQADSDVARLFATLALYFENCEVLIPDMIIILK